jgi:hypothetical protein
MSETLVLNRSDLRDARLIQGPTPTAGEGEAVLQTSRFALTANNVTYAVFGEAMRYWDFFPAPAGQGIAPVWGYADVVESRAPGLAVGERVFGFLPFGAHFKAIVRGLTAASFSDASPHRAGLSPFYNAYVRTSGEPGYDPALEDWVCLFRPLFMTGFLLDDWLGEANLFGAHAVIASSASSKTALAMAFGLKARGVRVIGLTSARNCDFVRRTGLYADVVAYCDLGAITVEPAAYIDFAGDAALTEAVHRHWGPSLASSTMVGGAHWDAARGAPSLGPAPALFFAPDVMSDRMTRWGGPGFHARYGAAWGGFLKAASAFMTVEHVSGLTAGRDAWLRLLDGAATPDRGLVVEV